MSNSPKKRVVVVGGGAAGFFAAITCAEAAGGALDVRILERGSEVLQKVKFSGGGRCNLTHDLDDPRALSAYYPRGSKAMPGLFYRWGQGDTVRWFAERGVEVKAEDDGRMFPVSDDSQTVVDCLKQAAEDAGVQVEMGVGVRTVKKRDGADGGDFELLLTGGKSMSADAVLIGTGGMRGDGARALLESLGHDMVVPCPSLFTFKIADPGLVALAGLAVPEALVRIPGTKLSASGPLLITHWGVSGPAILRLSAWGARVLMEKAYAFDLSVDWTGGRFTGEAVRGLLVEQAQKHGARRVARHVPVDGVPRRLWERLVGSAGIADETLWASLKKGPATMLGESLVGERFAVRGKSLNKEEFVTCGGVRLRDVDLKTMESRDVPGLYFAGEVLDIDGVTGGFNFQAAWTTGHIAGDAMAVALA